MQPDNSRVLIGTIEAGFLVKVFGKGTMEFCSDLFQFLTDKIEKGNPVSSVYFDLSETTYLDSSFIGVIVSIQKKLKKVGNANIILLNPSEKVKDILNTMGLFEILPIQEKNQYMNLDLTEEIQKKLDKNFKDVQLLLESHQNLMELNSENRKKFSLVEEMLKKELERQKNV